MVEILRGMLGMYFVWMKDMNWGMGWAKGRMSWAEPCLPNLTIRTSECDCIWRYGLYQIKMKSSGWALTEHGQHLCIKRGHLETASHIEEKAMWMWSQPYTSQGEALEQIPASQSSEGTNPANTLILDFGPLELWDITFLSFKLPSLWSSVVPALENQQNIHKVTLSYFLLRGANASLLI